MVDLPTPPLPTTMTFTHVSKSPKSIILRHERRCSPLHLRRGPGNNDASNALRLAQRFAGQTGTRRCGCLANARGKLGRSPAQRRQVQCRCRCNAAVCCTCAKAIFAYRLAKQTELTRLVKMLAPMLVNPSQCKALCVGPSCACVKARACVTAQFSMPDRNARSLGHS